MDLAERLVESGVQIKEGTPSPFPVFVERPGLYDTPGGWVIYLDRRVEWLPYPGPFPMSETFIQSLESLSASGSL
jgi:hypothetical protein